MTFIDFNNGNIPLGKRKQLYVKWLMRKKGLSLKEARLACSRKFHTVVAYQIEDVRINREIKQ
jgi:hypothetical protein